MKQSTDTTISQHLAIHWPAYAWRYGGIVAALLLIGVSLWRGWLGVIFLATAMLLFITYTLIAGAWGAQRLYGANGLQPNQILLKFSQTRSDDTVACIDLGLKQQALTVAAQLVKGKLYVVDVYNPQWNTGQALQRARGYAPLTISDPRIIWYDSPLNLLPLPNNSVTAVFLPQILSEFNQHGDRETLLREIRRILKPNGRLLFSERMATRTNWLTLAPGITRMQSADYWQTLLETVGFEIRRKEDLQGLISCWRADKPSPYAGKQLAFNLPLLPYE